MIDGSLIMPMLYAFGSLVLAGIGVPIPEELPTVIAGIWVASNEELGPLRWLILPVCYAGVILSDVMLYSIGRLWGPRLMQHRWLARFFPQDKRAKIEQNFQQYGVKILLFIRWIPAIRSPMFVTAGVMRVPLLRFVSADGIAAVLGHSLLFFLAWWFGDQFKAIVEQTENTLDTTIKPILILGAIVAIAAYFVLHFYRRPVSTADPTELPILGGKVAAKIDSFEGTTREASGERQPPVS